MTSSHLSLTLSVYLYVPRSWVIRSRGRVIYLLWCDGGIELSFVRKDTWMPILKKYLYVLVPCVRCRFKTIYYFWLCIFVGNNIALLCFNKWSCRHKHARIEAICNCIVLLYIYYWGTIHMFCNFDPQSCRRYWSALVTYNRHFWTLYWYQPKLSFSCFHLHVSR